MIERQMKTFTAGDTKYVINDAEARTAVADLENNLIVNQSSEPTAESNKIWIPTTGGNEVEVPEMDEFNELKSAIDVLDALTFSAYDLSNEPTIRMTISTSTGKWVAGSPYYTYYIAVPKHSKYVKIHANADNGTAYALLAATDTKTSGDFPVYATGSTRSFISANKEITVAIPSDCAYIWVSKQLGSPSYEPSVFGFYKDLNDVWELEADINDLDNAVDGISDEIGIIWDGTSGVTQYTQSQLISVFGQYSTLLLYSAADSNVGKTFPSQIGTTAANNVYAILMDVSDALTFTYPKYKNGSGNGCLLMDSNYTVTRNLPCISDDTGTMATITVEPNEKYFLFGVNSYLAAMDWTFTIAKRPVEGINDLSEHVQSIDEEVDNLSDIVDNIAQNGTVPPAKLNAEIVGFICYGQSWTMGYDTDAIVSTQRYDNIMLDSGLKNNPATDLVVSASEFSSLVEATTYSSDAQTTKCGETPCTAQTDIVKQLLFSENGLSDTDVKYQIFSAAPGMGNKSLEELAYGTVYYQRLIDVVTAANTIARAQNKVFVIPAISWAQGRATNGDATYYDQLEELRVHLDTDIKAITGQTIPVKMIIWQAVFGNTTPKRFYDRYVYASEKYENIICSGTFYYLNHKANNNLHLTATSQDWLGTQFGIAYKRSIIDGEKFIPLKPKTVEVYGNIAYLDFYVPVKPIVFDTTLVASVNNMGFQIFDGNNVEKTISAVEIVAPDRVKIVCTTDFASTDHIVYGGNGGTDYSPTTGKRGNLRDSQPIVYKNHANVDLPCYNWCVVFDKTISELAADN